MAMVFYGFALANHLCSKASCLANKQGQTVWLASGIESVQYCEMTWLRETPYSLHYYPSVETQKGIQGNDLGHSNNENVLENPQPSS
jgi:hypothetical protein